VYILAFIDNINDSYGPQTLDNGVEVVAVSADVEPLKDHANKKEAEYAISEGLIWEQMADTNQWIGNPICDDCEEGEQYYVIVEVQQI